MTEHIEVFTERTFEAAHSLGALPDDHKCHGLHGHHYRVRVYCSGPVDPETGFVIDYADIKAPLDNLIKIVDHSYLNEVLLMDAPTTENIARWFWGALELKLGKLLDRIEIFETNSNGCVYKKTP